jgi:BirA family biotin operon repressor/biotin-[acetyl-CoA-carboxylase] ligase
MLAEHDLHACCRWPNDVMVSGAKIAGILVEQAGDILVIGIGVNVSWPGSRSTPDGDVPWTSLRAETGIELERTSILAKLAVQIERTAAASAAVVLDAYRRCWCGPAAVRVRKGRTVRAAAAFDISAAGALRIRYDNGQPCDIVSSADIYYN